MEGCLGILGLSKSKKQVLFSHQSCGVFSKMQILTSTNISASFIQFLNIDKYIYIFTYIYVYIYIL